MIRLGFRLRGEILARRGLEVALETSPLETLQNDVLAFDFAIIDYDMSGLNGIQLLVALRASHAVYPVVLLSGQVSSIDPEQKRLLYKCLDKAESMQSLLRTVDHYRESRSISDLH